MKAATYAAAAIRFEDRSVPEPGPGQVLVRVHAAGLNRADLIQRQGHYPAPPGWPADIPGLEYAGVVEKTGPGVTRWTSGDRVMGLVGGGAHAEYVAVHQDETMQIPEGLTFELAAAIPEAYLTAWDALVARGRLVRGERVLIHAVTGGVGVAAVQVAHHLGAVVLGTSRSAERLRQLEPLGLDQGIVTRDRGFRDQVEPVDVIVDALGGPAFADNLAILKPLGRLVLLGFLQGSKVTHLDLGPILRERLTVVGTVMRSRTLAERVPLVRAFSEEILPLFDGTDPVLVPVIGRVFPFEELDAAHRWMEEGDGVGKVVVSVKGER